MSDPDQYRRRLESCLARAAKAPIHELRDIWNTIGQSYELLAEIEAAARDVFGLKAAGEPQIAPLPEGSQVPPEDDRIRSV